jgi:hypothetical protein
MPKAQAFIYYLKSKMISIRNMRIISIHCAYHKRERERERENIENKIKKLSLQKEERLKEKRRHIDALFECIFL